MRSTPCGRASLYLGLLAVLASTAQTAAAAPATRPATAPATQLAVPVVYVPGTWPARLTPEQSKVILQTAAEERPEGRRTWFVAVTYNAGRQCIAHVFYLPDRSSPRLRKGLYMDLSLERRRFEGATDEMRKTWRDQWWAIASWQANLPYVQVSRSGEPFPERGDPPVPAPRDVPFPEPIYPPGLGNDDKVRHISEDDLVRLVDFVRSPDRLDDRKSPICRIVASGPDLFGVGAGVLDSGGGWVHVRRKGGEFELVDKGGWVDAETIWWPHADEKRRDAQRGR